MPWGAAIAAAATIGSAVIGSSSASKSAKASKTAANKAAYAAGEAAFEQQGAYDQYRADSEPYMTAGNRALSLYESILSGVGLKDTSGYEAGFSPDGSSLGLSAFANLTPAIRNAILSRPIKSPGASDWSETTFRKEIAQGARTGGSYLGVPQAEWQAALNKLNGVGNTAAGTGMTNGIYDSALEGAYGGAQDGTSFGIPQVDRYQAMQAALGRGDYSEFFNSPDYQFALSEGLKGVDRSAAARGNLLSGGQIKATEQYGQGLASQQFGSYYNRLSSDYANYLDRLNNLAITGQNAAAGVGASGINSAQALGSALQNAGLQSASGVVGANNAKSSGLNGIGSALGMFGGMAGGSSGLSGGSGGGTDWASLLGKLFNSGASSYTGGGSMVAG